MRKKRFYRNCILLNDFLKIVEDKTFRNFVEKVIDSRKRSASIKVIQKLNSEI